METGFQTWALGLSLGSPLPHWGHRSLTKKGLAGSPPVPKEVAGLPFRCPKRGHLSASNSSRRCKIHSPLPWLQVSPPGKNL